MRPKADGEAAGQPPEGPQGAAGPAGLDTMGSQQLSQGGHTPWQGWMEGWRTGTGGRRIR